MFSAKATEEGFNHPETINRRQSLEEKWTELAEITAQRPRLSEKFLHNSSITLPGRGGRWPSASFHNSDMTYSPFPRDMCVSNVFLGQNARGLFSSRVTCGDSGHDFICNAFSPSLLTNPSTPRWLTLGRGRLLQQQRGSRSSANNHNPRRPICRPAPLFRLPPPPPLQLMMIAPARSLPRSLARGIYSCPSFIRLIHCSGIIVRGGQFGFGEWGDENWGCQRETERDGRTRTGLLLAGPPPQCHGVLSPSAVHPRIGTSV